jgi:plastocyanin
MKPLACAWVLVLAFWAPEGHSQATVEGTVALPPPGHKPVPLPHYPGQNVQPAPPEPATAVVYLAGVVSPKPTAETPPIVHMGQRGLQFIPSLLPVQAGTWVDFPNYDDLYHNVFSYSKPKRFDLGRYRKDEKPAAQRFDKPGLIKLNCEIHTHMRAYILVLDTPHFTRTDPNGRYRLANLPEGKFLLTAWLDEKTTLEHPVELKAGPPLRVDFSNP